MFSDWVNLGNWVLVLIPSCSWSSEKALLRGALCSHALMLGARSVGADTDPAHFGETQVRSVITTFTLFFLNFPQIVYSRFLYLFYSFPSLRSLFYIDTDWSEDSGHQQDSQHETQSRSLPATTRGGPLYEWPHVHILWAGSRDRIMIRRHLELPHGLLLADGALRVLLRVPGAEASHLWSWCRAVVDQVLPLQVSLSWKMIFLNHQSVLNMSSYLKTSSAKSLSLISPSKANLFSGFPVGTL